jgi:hypothetical protein
LGTPGLSIGQKDTISSKVLFSYNLEIGGGYDQSLLSSLYHRYNQLLIPIDWILKRFSTWVQWLILATGEVEMERAVVPGQLRQKSS